MGTAPIVIIGMHRSGTTILTRILEDSGVYFGNIKDTNSESFFFQRLNNWIMRQSGTNWDSAEMETNLDSEKDIEIIKELAGQLRNIRRIEFLGWANLFKYTDIREIDFNWGWKDPRNTFTFSFWNHLFPDAKIIHIYRNPIDVAESLKTREKYLKASLRSLVFHRTKEFILKLWVGFQRSKTVENLDQGLRLWEKYMIAALKIENDHPSRCIRVKYEDFLENPETTFIRILQFLNLEVDNRQLKQALNKVNPARKYAFLENPELITVYKRIQKDPLITQLGYDNLI